MVKVKVDSSTYYYDSATDVYADYPEAVYVGGYFIAEEKEDEEQ